MPVKVICLPKPATFFVYFAGYLRKVATAAAEPGSLREHPCDRCRDGVGAERMSGVRLDGNTVGRRSGQSAESIPGAGLPKVNDSPFRKAERRAEFRGEP